MMREQSDRKIEERNLRLLTEGSFADPLLVQWDIDHNCLIAFTRYRQLYEKKNKCVYFMAGMLRMVNTDKNGNQLPQEQFTDAIFELSVNKMIYAIRELDPVRAYFLAKRLLRNDEIDEIDVKALEGMMISAFREYPTQFEKYDWNFLNHKRIASKEDCIREAVVYNVFENMTLYLKGMTRGELYRRKLNMDLDQLNMI
jgi:hypothetical protein